MARSRVQPRALENVVIESRLTRFVTRSAPLVRGHLVRVPGRRSFPESVVVAAMRAACSAHEPVAIEKLERHRRRVLRPLVSSTDGGDQASPDGIPHDPPELREGSTPRACPDEQQRVGARSKTASRPRDSTSTESHLLSALQSRGHPSPRIIEPTCAPARTARASAPSTIYPTPMRRARTPHGWPQPSRARTTGTAAATSRRRSHPHAIPPPPRGVPERRRPRRSNSANKHREPPAKRPAISPAPVPEDHRPNVRSSPHRPRLRPKHHLPHAHASSPRPPRPASTEPSSNDGDDGSDFTPSQPSERDPATAKRRARAPPSPSFEIGGHPKSSANQQPARAPQAPPYTAAAPPGS